MKSIVVYFSKAGENYSNGAIVNLSKGNTDVAAEFIRDITGADLFHIEPKHEATGVKLSKSAIEKWIKDQI